jgi:[acyl-carrier-protein] S-malonyltransferase
MEKSGTIAFVFPGQGSQHIGMGMELAAAYPVARETFAEADECLGFRLSDLCWHGTEEELTDTVNAQPALLTCSIAALRVFINCYGDMAPRYMAGHSLGEITALVAAGIISFADGVRLVRRRGEVMKAAAEIQPGGMAVLLDADTATAELICGDARSATGGIIQIANDNCPGQIVISGDHETLKKALTIGKEYGVKRAAKLPVSIAAHSLLMQPARNEFERYVETLTLSASVMPVVGNIRAKPFGDLDEIRWELADLLVSPVRWSDSIRYMAHNGVTTIIEFGPLDVLTRLLPWFNLNVTGMALGTPEAILQLRL